MRTPEDPCRDPASEARDDHASEPRATPETDAMEYRFINHDSCAGESLERVMDDKDVTWDDAFRGDACPSDFARRLERQRDELMEAVYAIEERFVDGCDTYGDWEFMGQKARAAIAAVKGGRDE